MDNGYRLAELSQRLRGEIKRLETQINRDTGKDLVLLAYEQETQATPVFHDIQQSGPDEIKQNVFQSKDNMYGNITQWHM